MEHLTVLINFLCVCGHSCFQIVQDKPFVIEEIRCLQIPLICFQICASGLGVRNGDVQMAFDAKLLSQNVLHFPLYQMIIDMCVCVLERGRGEGAL